MSDFSTMSSESLPRPPSVPERVWEAVPLEFRKDFIERAAMALRTGIHPEDTFLALLRDGGISFSQPASPNKLKGISLKKA